MSLTDLLDEIAILRTATPDLAGFAPWPDDLRPTLRPATPVPAIDRIHQLDPAPPLIAAIQAAAPQADWRRTYTEAEVGADFLHRYGYFELFGPQGHFHSAQLRGYIAFWDDDLDYGWHHHEAEELYFGFLGTPLFRSKTKPDTYLAPGNALCHAPWESHAMRMHNTPFLCYALWKGPGLDGRPAMERP